MATGYDRVFNFAPQFGKYQILVYFMGFISACLIYGPFLSAGVYFQVLEYFQSFLIEFSIRRNSDARRFLMMQLRAKLVLTIQDHLSYFRM